MPTNIQTLIEQYQISASTADLVKSAPLLLISGVVGGGKNTVINEILKEHDRYSEIVSHTTRPPRANQGVMEQEGVDYHFIDAEAATRMIENQEFIEVKCVHGNLYGTSAAELKRTMELNKIAITDVDIHGVIEYLDIKPDTHAIFLLPPSVETWMKRLERRYGDLSQHEAEIIKRLKTAQNEITHTAKDKRFILVINDDLGTTVERITQIVDGERSETSEYAYTIVEHLLEYIGRRVGR